MTFDPRNTDARAATEPAPPPAGAGRRRGRGKGHPLQQAAGPVSAGDDLLAVAAARLAGVLARADLAAADLASLAPLAERLAADQSRRAFIAALARLQAELPAVAERGESATRTAGRSAPTLYGRIAPRR